MKRAALQDVLEKCMKLPTHSGDDDRRPCAQCANLRGIVCSVARPPSATGAACAAGEAGTGGAAVTDDQREQYEERAGILEYCAGMTREEAERVAMQMVLGGANDNQNKQRSCRGCP